MMAHSSKLTDRCSQLNMNKEFEDLIPPPILKSWRNLYIFVLVFHALLITAFYVVTHYYSV